MAKPKNSFEQMARNAAERLDKVREQGGQLTFLPDEDGRAVEDIEDRAPGRPKGAKGKVNSQLRDWLAARGFKMPEDVLAHMAGLASDGDAVMAAMERAEMVLAWAYDGATERVDGVDRAKTPSASQRLRLFVDLYTIQLRAADALMPYGAPKASPDDDRGQPPVILVPVPHQSGSGYARDVTPQPTRIAGRMVPADVARDVEQKQRVSTRDPDKSDGDNRTE